MPDLSPTVGATAPLPGPSATPGGEISLLGGDAEVWAWQKRVTGQAPDLGCDSIEVHSGDQSIAAAVEGEAFSAELPLKAGENQVSALCQPVGQAAPPLTYTVNLPNRPVAVIDIKIENGSVVVDGSASQPAPVDSAALSEYSWSARPTNPTALTIASPAKLAGQALEGQVIAQGLMVTAPLADGEYYLTLTVTDEAGRSDSSSTYFVVAGGALGLDDWTWQNTDWVEQAIVYGVIPRNFGSPGFQAIIDRLDILQDVGVNTLWLAPINDSPPGDYGYAVRDYFKLRPQNGSSEDFKRMVQAAHERGIRVLMDFIPNHSSTTHRYFQDTLKYGQDSHYWDFYDRDETGYPTHYFDWDHLPNLNYDNPEVENWMTEAFAYWVREFDIDGFRVDVAWGIRQRKPDYWPRWRQALKRIKPDLLLLAEASARDEYYFTGGFDAAYDWTHELGHWAWEQVFETGNLLTIYLNTALTNNNQGYHPDTLIFHFLNNNDTGDRFITKYGLEMNRVATAMLLTLPGIPGLFTGDEVGAEFTPYGTAQQISWEDEHGLLAYHKQLVHLRLEYAALHSRAWQLVTAEPHLQIYAYLRMVADQPQAQPVLVLLNFFDQPAEVEVSLPEGFEVFTRQPLRELLGDQAVPASGTGPLRVSMGAYQAMLLTPQAAST